MIIYKTYSAVRPVSREVIEDALKNAQGKDIIFVAPEFAKAQVEREVLSFKQDQTRGNGTINAVERTLTLSSSLVFGDVLSFRKLAGNILDDLGTNYVAEGGEIMLRNAIYNILTKRKTELKAFSTLSSRIDYINLMIALLGDFSRYGVNAEDIDKAITALDKPETNVAFVNKLKDLRLIMNELEDLNKVHGLNLLREPISLACDKLSSVTDGKRSIRRSSGLAAILKSKIVFIGFGSTRMLTPKELKLVSLLSDLGAEIEFNVLSGSSESRYSSVYKTGEDFIAMIEGLGAKGSSLALVENSDALSLIVRSFAADTKIDSFDAEGKVRLAELTSIDDRVGYIFNEIIDLTRNHGYRYRDIRIVCCNEEITARMRSTAELYGLDVFIDRKIALDGTVVPYMMRILLELPMRNYPLNLIMNAMRSGMLSVPPYIADSFENYCYAKNIMNSERLFDENSYIDSGEEQQSTKYRLWIIDGTVPGYREGFVDSGMFFYEHIVRNKLVPLKEACNRIYGENTLAGKARESLNYFNDRRGYIEALRDEFLQKGDAAAAVALVRGYDELVGLLMCSTHEMNNCEIEQKDFLTMIRTDMRNRTEGTIPLKVDSIEITTPDHAFVTPCKVLFIIGAQKDNFPYVRMREGLLSGSELDRLSESTDSIELPNKAQSKMREEFVSACLLLGSATDMIYMVHEFGKPKSRVFEYLEKFSSEEHHIVNTFKNPIAGEAVKFRHHFEDAKIPSDVMSRLLTVRKDDGTKGKVIYASVSSIEKYRQCALSYMLERQLRIKQRDDNTSVQVNSFGTLIHGMFEHAYRTLRDDSKKDPVTFNTMAKELIDDPVKFDSFTDQCLKQSVSIRASYGSVDKDGNPKDKVFEMDTCSKLKRMFSKMFRDVLQESVNTGFIPEGVEAKIGSNELVLDIPYEGIDLRFSGYIDRYDLKKDENGMVHLRTIDYKSGNKAVESDKLLIGTQIQLPAYSGAILDKHSAEGAGAVVDDYGYVLLGLEASLDKDPVECFPKLAGYSDEAMKIAIDYSRHIIKESIDQIAEGKADAVTATPKNKNCSYCSYKSYCGNIPSASKGHEPIDLKVGGKYGQMVNEAENIAKSPEKASESDLDETAKRIGADKSMEKSDRIAILAMKDILEKTEKKSGEEE